MSSDDKDQTSLPDDLISTVQKLREDSSKFAEHIKRASAAAATVAPMIKAIEEHRQLLERFSQDAMRQARIAQELLKDHGDIDLTDGMRRALEAARVSDLENIRTQLAGRNSELNRVLRSLKKIPDETLRRAVASTANSAMQTISVLADLKRDELTLVDEASKEKAEAVDVTLPPVRPRLGAIHPVSQVMEELARIFGEMGFAVEEGPDIETDFNNFTALNFPPKHPAREMHDTFFMARTDADQEQKVLRTHTSPVQVRTMLKQPPPIRMICMGRTYRCDSDATHTPMFHQIEGLVIDETTSMADLKGVLIAAIKAFFEVDDVRLRFRPHHFPFTEPSAEVDVGCDRSGGQIRIGAGADWLEILGAGMVHPNVLKNCGIDPERYQGYAFGMGVDRLAMLKYGMPDLRDFFAADTRWLKHYGFSPYLLPGLAQGIG